MSTRGTINRKSPKTRVGAAKSLITIRSLWASGFEMTWIGAIEGVVTYVIGIGLGKLGGG